MHHFSVLDGNKSGLNFFNIPILGDFKYNSTLLTQLKIKNFALIEDLDVQFSGGMTCITGETGAGKSILLGGLTLVLGKRADLTSLFDSTKKCIVEATFQIKNYTLEPLFNKYDLDYEEETVLRRELLPRGKSRAFINDTPVNLDVLEVISLRLIDIHSQNDTQTLLQNEYQFQVLDALAENKMILEEYFKTFGSYKNILKEQRDLYIAKSDLKDSFELKQFLFKELKATNLDPGMEEELVQDINALTHVEYLQKQIGTSIDLLESETVGILDQLKELRRNTQGMLLKSKSYQNLNERIYGVTVELEDLIEEFKSKFDSLEANPQRLEELQSKFNHLNSLYQKHRVKTVEELISIRNDLKKNLTNTISLDERLIALKHKQNEQEAELIKQSKLISKNRKQAVVILVEELKKLVAKMGMTEAQFKIELVSSKDFLYNGTDLLSFKFSANRGSEFKILKKVVSGGELSRIMLAIKTILCRYKKLPTLIFDEVDTGVSGKISDSIAEVMATMATQLQVFTITHLPQVAAKGNHHFKVEKILEDGKTFTRIKELNPKTRVDEIAKMLSGNLVTKTAIAHAKQLMN